MSKTTVRPGAEDRVDPVKQIVDWLRDLERRVSELEARDGELR